MSRLAFPFAVLLALAVSPAHGQTSFVPGSQPLFVLDLSSGRLPDALFVESGGLEVADFRGKRMLRVLGNTEFLITLPAALPESYTVEYELVLPAGEVYPSSVSVDGRQVQAACGPGPAGFQAPDRSPSIRFLNFSTSRIHTCRLAVNGRDLRLWVNQVAAGGITADFGSGDALRFAVPEWPDAETYIGAIRVAAGGGTTVSAQPTVSPAPQTVETAATGTAPTAVGETVPTPVPTATQTTAPTATTTATAPQLTAARTELGSSTTFTAGAAPSGLNATVVSATTARISWNGAAGATSYSVERGPSASGPWRTVTPASFSATSYQDSGLGPNLTVYYRVAAHYPLSTDRVQRTNNLAPGYTSAVSVRTPDAQPADFAVREVKPGELELTWTPLSSTATHDITVVSGSADPVTGAAGGRLLLQAVPVGPQTFALHSSFDVPGVGTARSDAARAPTAAVTVTALGGWYAVYLDAIEVQRQTVDHMLNTDGWGDEAFVSVAFAETGPDGLKQCADCYRFPRTGAMGDISAYGISELAGRGQEGKTPKTGGLLTTDIHYTAGSPSPRRVWCGRLQDGVNGVMIIPTVWEFDNASSEGFTRFAKWVRQHHQDLQQERVKEAAMTFNAVWGSFMQAGAVMNELAADGVLGLLDALGPAADRPIGMNAERSFTPIEIPLTYLTAEKILTEGFFGQGTGRLPIRYRDAPNANLDGEYTLQLRLARVSQDVCTVVE